MAQENMPRNPTDEELFGAEPVDALKEQVEAMLVADGVLPPPNKGPQVLDESDSDIEFISSKAGPRRLRGLG